MTTNSLLAEVTNTNYYDSYIKKITFNGEFYGYKPANYIFLERCC